MEYRLIFVILVVLELVTSSPVTSANETEISNSTVKSTDRHARQEDNDDDDGDSEDGANTRVTERITGNRRGNGNGNRGNGNRGGDGNRVAGGGGGTAAYGRVSEILSGVLRGDIRRIFSGSTSFIPNNNVRDGVNQLLERQIGWELHRFLTNVGGNLGDRLNDVVRANEAGGATTLSPDQQLLLLQQLQLQQQLQQQQQQQQLLQNQPIYANPSIDGNNFINPNVNNFNQNFDAYQNTNLQTASFNGYNYNTNNLNQIYQNPNNIPPPAPTFIKNSPVVNSLPQTPVAPTPNGGNGQDQSNDSGGITIPNPIQLIRDRLGGGESFTNPLQSISNPLQSIPNPIQAIQERIQNLFSSGTEESPATNSSSNGNNANNNGNENPTTLLPPNVNLYLTIQVDDLEKAISSASQSPQALIAATTTPTVSNIPPNPTSAPIASAASTTVVSTNNVEESVGDSGNLLEETGLIISSEVNTASGVGTVTQNKTKYKVRGRTRRPYVPNEDDEDESRVLNRIKNL